MASSTDAVAGPGGVVVTAPAANQLTAVWTADANPTTFKYYVFQSTAGGAFTLVASVLQPSGLPPAPTTYTAVGLVGGVQYCYAIESAYTDGLTSALGAPGCGTATGPSTQQRAYHTRKLSQLSGVSIGAGGFQILGGVLTGNWSPVNDGDLLGVPLDMFAGEQFEQVIASIYGNSAYTITESVYAQDDAFHAGAQLGLAQSSVAQNTLQTLIVVPTANDNSGTNEQITTMQRSYYLQFRAHKIGPSDGGLAFVGPLMLVTSTAN